MDADGRSIPAAAGLGSAAASAAPRRQGPRGICELPHRRTAQGICDFTQGSVGSRSGLRSAAEAQEKVLEACSKYAADCSVYAVNEDEVRLRLPLLEQDGYQVERVVDIPSLSWKVVVLGREQP